MTRILQSSARISIPSVSSIETLRIHRIYKVASLCLFCHYIVTAQLPVSELSLPQPFSYLLSPENIIIWQTS